MRLVLKRVDPTNYRARSYGMELWRVFLNGIQVYQGFSEAHARTKFLELKKKHGLK